MTTVPPAAPVSRRYAARPAAARMTTTRFIRLGPAPSAPRRPAVPNSRVPAKRSARSAASPPASTSATTASSSARVTGSGSSAAQARARSRRSGCGRRGRCSWGHGIGGGPERSARSWPSRAPADSVRSVYTPPFNRAEDEDELRSARRRGARGMAGDQRPGRGALRHLPAGAVARRPGGRPPRPGEPALARAGARARDAGAGHRHRARRLRVAVLVRREGGARQGRADVELQRRPPHRPGAGAPRPRVAPRGRRAADRRARGVAGRAVAGRGRAGLVRRRPAAGDRRRGAHRDRGRGQGQAQPEPLPGGPCRSRRRPARQCAPRRAGGRGAGGRGARGRPAG